MIRRIVARKPPDLSIASARHLAAACKDYGAELEFPIGHLHLPPAIDLSELHVRTGDAQIVSDMVVKGASEPARQPSTFPRPACFSRCYRQILCGSSASSIPTAAAYTIFAVSCLAVTFHGHPQCAANAEQTRTQTSTLQGWLVAMLATALSTIYLTGVFKRVQISPLRQQLRPDVLQRSDGVLRFVGWSHFRTGFLLLMPVLLLTTLMTAAPERICMISEIRMMLIGCSFSACKSLHVAHRARVGAAVHSQQASSRREMLRCCVTFALQTASQYVNPG